MRVSNSPFFVFLQKKLQKFFEVLMLLLLIFPLFFIYLSDINNNINNKQTSNFFLNYPHVFHNSKMFYFRRCFHVAWC